MDRYYIPTSDEFRVGFIYEIENVDTEMWESHIFTLEDFNWAMLEDNKMPFFRIKKLDKKDIESLGFQYDDVNEEYVSIKTFLGVSTGDDKKLHIYYDEDTYEMLIYYKSNNGYEYVVFDGYDIKNLFEFKLLLSKKLKIEWK